MFTIRIINPRSPRHPYTEHVGLTAVDVREVVAIYRALGYQSEHIKVWTDGTHTGKEVAR
jgi:hypothetical protein